MTNPISYFWPYAAKPIVQHEYDTDHLNIWLTFPYTMNILLKPSLTKWTAFVDDIEKEIVSSEWQDEYTLLLIIENIESLPDRVLLTYEGAGPIVWNRNDPNRETLEIKWQKQYEPFNKILSLNITT